MESLFLDFALLGAQWVLWLLIALSIVSVSVMFERWRFFRQRRASVAEIIDAAHESLESGSPSAALTDSLAVQAVVAASGIRAADGGVGATAEAMNSAKAHGREKYERNLVILGTLGNNAPFIGLFGTVLGIVGAFSKLAGNPEGGIDVVGADLSQALVATAVGILVALPAVVSFNYFNRRVRSAMTGADEVAHAILSKLHHVNATEKKA
jgi:biopolymer transport protein ExbB